MFVFTSSEGLTALASSSLKNGQLARVLLSGELFMDWKWSSTSIKSVGAFVIKPSDVSGAGRWLYVPTVAPYVVTSVSSARSIPSSTYVTGAQVWVVTLETHGEDTQPSTAIYVWDPSLVASDDGVHVLKPSDVSTGAGRLVASFTHAEGVLCNPDGLKVIAGDSANYAAPTNGNLNLIADVSKKVEVIIGSATPMAASSSGIGFNSATPIGKQPVVSAPSTTFDIQQACEKLSAALINLGLAYASTQATQIGAVDLNGITWGSHGDLDGLGLTVYTDLGHKTVTFDAPASKSDLVSQINNKVTGIMSIGVAALYDVYLQISSLTWGATSTLTMDLSAGTRALGFVDVACSHQGSTALVTQADSSSILFGASNDWSLGAGTVMVWCKRPAGAVDRATIFHMWELATIKNDFSFGFAPGGLPGISLIVNDMTVIDNTYAPAGTYADDFWHFFALVWNTTSAILYVDGIAVVTQPIGDTPGFNEGAVILIGGSQQVDEKTYGCGVMQTAHFMVEHTKLSARAIQNAMEGSYPEGGFMVEYQYAPGATSVPPTAGDLSAPTGVIGSKASLGGVGT